MKPFAAMFRYPTATFPPLAQRQSFFPMDPLQPVLPHLPALPVQQHQYLAISVSHSSPGDLRDPHPEFGPGILVAAVPVGPAAHPAHPADPSAR
jgi:hypothetical protein